MWIEFRDVGYTYSRHTPFACEALQGLNLMIDCSGFTGLIGPTASGKSTLIRLLGGLVQPSKGEIRLISRKKGSCSRLCAAQVGVVFQQPENQLFSATVVDEVAYAARNAGLRGAELDQRVRWSMEAVGLDIDELGHRSPFRLGGGEKRLVAIASVLVMRPILLALDEPTANLDPKGRRTILDCVTQLHSEQQVGVLVATHHIEDVFPLVDRVIALDRGRLALDCKPREALVETDKLLSIGLRLPALSRLVLALRERGLAVRVDVCDVPEAVQEIRSAVQAWREGNQC